MSIRNVTAGIGCAGAGLKLAPTRADGCRRTDELEFSDQRPFVLITRLIAIIAGCIEHHAGGLIIGNQIPVRKDCDKPTPRTAVAGL